MKSRIQILIASLCIASSLSAEVPVSVTAIDSGDFQSMRDVVDLANTLPGLHEMHILPNASGETFTRFPGPAPGSDAALGELRGRLAIRGACHPRCILEPDSGASPGLRLIGVQQAGFLEIQRIEILRFDGSPNGGAILGTGEAEIHIRESWLRDNQASALGGAVSIEGQACLDVRNSLLAGNLAGVFGNDLNIDSTVSKRAALHAEGNIFNNVGGTVAVENPEGDGELNNNTLRHFPDGIDSTAQLDLTGNILDGPVPPFLQSDSGSKTRPEALCNDFGTNAFNSLGYNIATDNSCDLDQKTDLPDTHPILTETDDGLLIPDSGSPAIDSGMADVRVNAETGLAELPCGYRDVAGTGRPQDANGDGAFECDRGAMEVPGKGAIVPGHSSVFFNPARNGEGNYVEILADGRAVVYTFTYNTDGTGPAWFLGVGLIYGNSIVLDNLYRPIGTPFGDDFVASEVEFTPAGSMSMVFPDCQASAPGGNIAFTGDPGLGYEGLITRATRLAHIAGCGAETPHPNAGLSASYYDPARNGEGLIIEWLTNGDVLAVFFTYDTEGNQFWLFGQAAADGKSVTMKAIYPTSFTPWGRDYNPADVALDSWGTFTITWTDCNTLVFEYDSTVPGFGSATRNYTRLSTLAGLNCPEFP